MQLSLKSSPLVTWMASAVECACLCVPYLSLERASRARWRWSRWCTHTVCPRPWYWGWAPPPRRCWGTGLQGAPWHGASDRSGHVRYSSAFVPCYLRSCNAMPFPVVLCHFRSTPLMSFRLMWFISWLCVLLVISCNLLSFQLIWFNLMKSYVLWWNLM